MKLKLCAVILFLFGINSWSQNGFEFKTRKNKINIPFQFINNLIIIPIEVNGTKLNFMVDTGVDETILFSLDDTDEVSFSKIEKIKIKGFGENSAFEAFKSVNNTLKIKDYIDVNHSIFLVLDQNINISSQVGIPVNGIIGNKLFQNNLLKIDYIRKLITLYKTDKNPLLKDKNHSKFPINLIQGKPYINVSATFKDDNPAVNSLLLIDTGNTDAFWFFEKKNLDIQIPTNHIDDFLGRGFSGDVYGKRGRIPSISFNEFKFINPIVAFPDSKATTEIDKIENRIGSVGSEVMRRFSTYYDYKNKLVYIKKNSKFYDPFNFNMSGIEVQHSGLQWISESFESNPVVSNNLFDAYGNKIVNNLKYKFELKPVYIIANVRKNSSAEIIGIKKDDIITKINNQNSYNFTLEKINEILKSEKDKFVELEINRDGKFLQFKIELKNIL